jgi:hypothetical protein
MRRAAATWQRQKERSGHTARKLLGHDPASNQALFLSTVEIAFSYQRVCDSGDKQPVLLEDSLCLQMQRANGSQCASPWRTFIEVCYQPTTAG